MAPDWGPGIVLPMSPENHPSQCCDPTLACGHQCACLPPSISTTKRVRLCASPAPWIVGKFHRELVYSWDGSLCVKALPSGKPWNPRICERVRNDRSGNAQIFPPGSHWHAADNPGFLLMHNHPHPWLEGRKLAENDCSFVIFRKAVPGDAQLSPASQAPGLAQWRSSPAYQQPQQ